MSEETPKTCGAMTRRGEPCKWRAGWGTDHVGYGNCKLHTGCTPNGKKSAALQEIQERIDLIKIDGSLRRVTDPIEAIVETHQRAAWWVSYCELRLRELGLTGDLAESVVQTTERNPDEFGDGRGYVQTRESSPELHIWVRAYLAAVSDLQRFSREALQLGIEARIVENTERLAHGIAAAMRDFAVRMGTDPDDPKVRASLRAALHTEGAAHFNDNDPLMPVMAGRRRLGGS